MKNFAREVNERAIGTVKQLMRKPPKENNDIHLALLHYCNTPVRNVAKLRPPLKGKFDRPSNFFLDESFVPSVAQLDNLKSTDQSNQFE